MATLSTAEADLALHKHSDVAESLAALSESALAATAAPLFSVSPVTDKRAQPQLRRVVGMVQDVNGEPSFYRAPRAAFFAAFANPDSEAVVNTSGDFVDVMCHQCYVVPVPGYATAAAPHQASEPTDAVGPRKPKMMPKRERSVDDAEKDDDAAPMNDAMPVPGHKPEAAGEPAAAPTRGATTTAASPQRDGMRWALNLPAPATAPSLYRGALVLVPEAAGRAPPRICDLVELTGFVAPPRPVDEPSVAAPGSGGAPLDAALAGFEEDEAWAPWLPTRLPRHLIDHVLVAGFRVLPHVDAVDRPSSSTPTSPATDALATARATAVAALTDLLHGDALAAEYALLNAVSTVCHRVPACAVGPVSVRVDGVPADVAAPFASQLCALLPAAVNVNTGTDPTPWVPGLSFAENGLRTGVLQLPAGTHVTVYGPSPVIVPDAPAPSAAAHAAQNTVAPGDDDAPEDEATVRTRDALAKLDLARPPTRPAGQMTQAEVEAVSDVVQRQRLQVPYGLTTVTLETDIGLLRLAPPAATAPSPASPAKTPGGTAAEDPFPSLVDVPWVPRDAALDDGDAARATSVDARSAAGSTPERNGGHGRRATPALPSSVAEEVANYIRAARTHHRAAVAIGEGLTQESIVRDLSDLRTTAPEQHRSTAAIDESTAHVRMSLARAIAATHGAACIRPCDWAAVKSLEAQRFARLGRRS